MGNLQLNIRQKGTDILIVGQNFYFSEYLESEDGNEEKAIASLWYDVTSFINDNFDNEEHYQQEVRF